MDLGFGEVFDRVEKHLGRKLTKSLVFVAYLAMMSLFASSIYDYVVKPIVENGPDVAAALGWVDVARIALTLGVGGAMASWSLDVYRIRLLREEYEETSSEAHDILDEFRAYRLSSQTELKDMIGQVEGLVDQGKRITQASRDLHTANGLIAVELLKTAERGDRLSDEQVSSLRTMIDEYAAFERVYEEVSTRLLEHSPPARGETYSIEDYSTR